MFKSYWISFGYGAMGFISSVFKKTAKSSSEDFVCASCVEEMKRELQPEVCGLVESALTVMVLGP